MKTIGVDSMFEAFRLFIFENAGLVQSMLTSLKSSNQKGSFNGRFVGSSSDSFISTMIQNFDDFPTMASIIRIALDAALLDTSGMQNILSDFFEKKFDSKILFVNLTIDNNSYRSQATISEEFRGEISNDPSVSTFRFKISELHNDFFDYNVTGLYSSFDCDDNVNKLLKTQFYLTYKNPDIGVDSVGFERKVNDHLHKRVAVYDNVKNEKPRILRRISKNEKTNKLLMTAMKSNALFSSYSISEHEKIVEVFESIVVSPGEIVIRQGDPGEYFYVVESGKMDLFLEGSDGQRLSTGRSIVSGGSFGELALLYNIPRTASVIATEEGTLWRVDRYTYRQVISQSEQLSVAENVAFIKDVCIMGHRLGDMVLERDLFHLVSAAEQEQFQPGEVIIRQDQAGDCFYIIKKGDVSVCRAKKRGTAVVVAADDNALSDEDQKTATDRDEGNNDASSNVSGVLDNNGLGVCVVVLHQGDYFGEKALLEEDVRQASCVAVGPVECLSLSRDMFIRMVGNWNDLAADKDNRILKQLQHQHQQHGAVLGGGSNSSSSTGTGTASSVAVTGEEIYLEESINNRQHSVGSGDALDHVGVGVGLVNRARCASSSIFGSNDDVATSTSAASITSPPLPPPLISFSSHWITSSFLNDDASPPSPSNASSSSSSASSGSSSTSAAISSSMLFASLQLADVEQLLTLGTGAFGKVRLVRHKQSRQLLVLKIQVKKVELPLSKMC